MTRPAIYLDHNASAPLLPEARDALVAALALAGNPSSPHGHGRALMRLIEAARGKVAALAGAERSQVAFTGSATEAIAQAIIGGVKALKLDAVVIGAGEHAAVGKSAEMTALPVTRVGLDADGVMRVEEVAARLREAERSGESVLVAVQAVNNETGVVQPLHDIANLVGPTRHVLFIDAVQAFGKLPLEFAASPADMMAVSAHKIAGPVGVGALLVKSHADSVRLIQGGGHEQGRRAGTQSAALISAFGVAADLFPGRFQGAKVAALIDAMEAGLRRLAPDLVIFGESAGRVGNVVNFAVPGLNNAVAMVGLDLMGLSVSSGSACSSGKVGRSHVLAAMGVTPGLSEGALRVSLGWNSTPDDVDAFLKGFELVLDRQRGRQGQAA